MDPLANNSINTLVVEVGTSGIRICESNNQHVVDDNRRKKFNTKLKDCTRIDFFDNLLEEIVKDSDIHLVFVTVSNESTFQSYSKDLFDSSLIPMGYYPIKDSSLTRADFNSVRVHLYCRNDTKKYFGNRSIQTARLYFSGANYGSISLRFSLFIKNREKIITFTGISLPSDDSEKFPQVIRDKKLQFLNKLINDVVNKNGVSSDHSIIAGNFGFLIDLNKLDNNTDDKTLDSLVKLDFLNKKLTIDGGILREYHEGNDGFGPHFFPTYSMKKGRDVDVCQNYFNNEFLDNRDLNTDNYFRDCVSDNVVFTGWPSRILYQGGVSKSYNGIEFGNSRKMDTVAIEAVIQFY